MSGDNAAAVVDDERATGGIEPSVERGRTSRGGRWALVTFAAYLVVAFFVLLHLGRHYWFYQDEWTLLLRNAGSPKALLLPLNQHWVTLPLLVFHLLFWIFGLTYTPYQICTITLHLTLVVLLRVIMRRAGVGPWFATVAASTFVLFGSGSVNILQSIQMSLVGSVVFGVCHLLCADHDGRFTRLDALGLTFGALSLMASGIGTVMVVVVGMAVLLRRGWRMAAIHTVPLVLLNGAWYFAERKYQTGKLPSNPLKYIVEWNTTGVRAVFVALGNYRVVSVALAVLLIAGLVIAWRPLAFAELRKQASAPAAMLLGVPVLLALVSTQRYNLPEADSSKFVHISTALTLPALAVAAQAVARRWRVTTPIVLVLLLIGVPGNFRGFSSDGLFQPGFFAHEKFIILGAAHSPLANQVSRYTQPYNIYYGASGVTVGWLLNARKDGRVPSPPHLSTNMRDEIVVHLGVQQVYRNDLGRLRCKFYKQARVIYPAKGDVYVFNQTVGVRYRRPTGSLNGGGASYAPLLNGLVALQVQLPGLRLHVTPYYYYPLWMCREATSVKPAPTP